jgi:tetrahydromethanopterin S-methyltransferase subunit F
MFDLSVKGIHWYVEWGSWKKTEVEDFQYSSSLINRNTSLNIFVQPNSTPGFIWYLLLYLNTIIIIWAICACLYIKSRILTPAKLHYSKIWN